MSQYDEKDVRKANYKNLLISSTGLEIVLQVPAICQAWFQELYINLFHQYNPMRHRLLSFFIHKVLFDFFLLVKY